jgi:hypothetical protein
VPDQIRISGIDAPLHGADNISCIIDSEEMLFDTGAHVSCITDDLLPETFVQYLVSLIHAPYRGPSSSTKVQVAVVFAFK